MNKTPNNTCNENFVKQKFNFQIINKNFTEVQL